jgi:hypothetical protein
MTPPRLPSGPRQSSFFDPAEVGPRPTPRPPIAPPPPAEPARALSPQERPAAWRAPTKGEEACYGCAGAACYGQDGRWFCYDCRPAGFLPKDRVKP